MKQLKGDTPCAAIGTPIRRYPRCGAKSDALRPRNAPFRLHLSLATYAVLLMSFITRIRKSAQNAARNQLSKLGIQIPDADMPCDEDTQDRDIVDIYRDIVQKSQPVEMHPDPVPEELRPILEAATIPLCGANEVLKATMMNWISNRESTTCAQILPPTIDNLRAEALQLLHTASVVQKTGEQWETTLTTIARAQFRPVINLIHQAALQIAPNTGDWMTSLNQRLVRYKLAIVQIADAGITLVDTGDEKSIRDFWDA